MFTNIYRAVRVLRLKRGWSQRTLGERAGLSRELISRLERGAMAGMTTGNLDRVVTALGATLHIQVRWQGERLDQLLDAAHASLQQATADLLSRLGWIVRIEVSFNQYGDRGRIDILAYHPRLQTLLIVEVKSVLGDLQETLGRLDVKVRVARQIARDLGWTDVATVLPALVISDSRVARRVVAAHAALFARYAARGRAALAWLRRPNEPVPTGVLWFANRPDSHPVAVRRGQRAPKGPDSHVA